MAVGDAKNTIPEDTQASFIWRFVEDALLKEKKKNLKTKLFPSGNDQNWLPEYKVSNLTFMIEISGNINKKEGTHSIKCMLS